MHTILIANQQPLFREAMGRALDAAASRMPRACPPEVMETDDLGRTFSLIQAQRKLDLILIDPKMPGMSGLDSLLRLRSAFPAVPVALIWDGRDQQMALQSVACGATGVISKTASPQQMDEAISHMLRGGIYLPPDILCTDRHAASPCQILPIVPAWLQRLTRRQLLVLERMSRGESNKQIAWALGIAETTVKSHVSMILQKLGVHNRVQAILMAKDVDFSVYIATDPPPSSATPVLHAPAEPLHV